MKSHELIEILNVEPNATVVVHAQRGWPYQPIQSTGYGENESAHKYVILRTFDLDAPEPPPQPPCDNDHVEAGCEMFSDTPHERLRRLMVAGEGLRDLLEADLSALDNWQPEIKRFLEELIK